MVDLHSHILFGIDDGASDIEESLELLERAKKAGTKKLFLTPHFSIGDDVEKFLKLRDGNFEKLKEKTENIEIKCGAEVYITEELFNEDKLNKLTLGESRVILCEFKYHNLSGEKFLDYVDYVIEEGYIPLIAHVERYSFLRKNNLLMRALLSRKVLLQVNAISFFEDSEEGDFARELYEEGVIFGLGSDMHHIGSKRYRAMEELWKNIGKAGEKILKRNPEKIFDNNLEFGDE